MVNFTEGQEVHKGDTLANIDPRPLEAALTQAVAKKAQDQAQLVSAQKGPCRYSDLAKRGQRDPAKCRPAAGQGRPAQGNDRRRSGGDRERANAALLRDITAPSTAASASASSMPATSSPTDPQPLTVLTQIQAAMVIFTLPQKNLGDVRERCYAGRRGASNHQDRSQPARGRAAFC